MELLKYNNTVIALLNEYPDEVLVEMAEKNMTWDGIDVHSSLTLVAKKMNIGNMISTIKLTIKGNAFFTDTNKDEITITTSQLGPITIPITINGSGTIMVFPSIMMKKED